MTNKEIEEFRNLEVGKTFTFLDKTLKVVKNTNIGCHSCFFNENKDYCCYREVLPYCDGFGRNDSKIIFKEVKNEIKN